MKAMSPFYSVWRWSKLPIPQILPSRSQSDPNSPRRKKARYLPERPSQQRRPMSPYIVRLGPVRERKRQPEQVPGNGALGGDHSIPMTLSGPHGTERTYRPGFERNAANMWARIQNWRWANQS